jgi:hypothetical protein
MVKLQFLGNPSRSYANHSDTRSNNTSTHSPSRPTSRYATSSRATSVYHIDEYDTREGVGLNSNSSSSGGAIWDWSKFGARKGLSGRTSSLYSVDTAGIPRFTSRRQYGVEGVGTAGREESDSDSDDGYSVRHGKRSTEDRRAVDDQTRELKGKEVQRSWLGKGTSRRYASSFDDCSTGGPSDDT